MCMALYVARTTNRYSSCTYDKPWGKKSEMLYKLSKILNVIFFKKLTIFFTEQLDHLGQIRQNYHLLK